MEPNPYEPPRESEYKEPAAPHKHDVGGTVLAIGAGVGIAIAVVVLRWLNWNGIVAMLVISSALVLGLVIAWPISRLFDRKR